jgi:hypothetical protein
VRVLDFTPEHALIRFKDGTTKLNFVQRVSGPAGGLIDQERDDIKAKLDSASALLRFVVDCDATEAGGDICHTQFNQNRYESFQDVPFATITFNSFWLIDIMLGMREKNPEREYEVQFGVACAVHEMTHFLGWYLLG